MRNLVLIAAAGALMASSTGLEPSWAQTAPVSAATSVPALAPMDAAERRDVIETLAKNLDDYFVFPDVAHRYAAMLRDRLASGAYDGLADPTAFGERVTADLQAVSRDGHLRLALKDAFTLGRPPAAGAPASTPLGLEETRMIGDVAYLRFSLFPDDPAVADRARQFLIDHADARAVIIDSRPNHGGGLAVMDAILPLLYAAPTVLVRMDTRAAAGGDEDLPYASLVRQPSPADMIRADHHVTPDAAHPGLRQVPVYYLTSSRTASAAEHLALAFKRTHRAILVGETTRGAGHFGGVQPIGARFAAFIPVGRTYDPETNWDWEGKGVAPDVNVPADKALDEALSRARAAGAHPN